MQMMLRNRAEQICSVRVDYDLFSDGKRVINLNADALLEIPGTPLKPRRSRSI